MSNIRIILNRLSRNFGVLKEQIRLENSVNDQSLNVLLETKILHIYNIIHDTNFTNANLIYKNFPAIDGIDDRLETMIQVTSTFRNEKIEHTVNQVLDNVLYEKYNNLKFIFLGDKQKLTQAFKKKILDKIGNKFYFDFDKDLIDLNDLYGSLHKGLDLEKIHKTVEELNNVLDFLPESKITGIDVVAISFDEEELDTAFLFVEALIKEGMNVYTSSKNLYNKFKINSKYKDFIIYADELIKLSHIDFCIVILSKSFIQNNFIRQSNEHKCHLFETAKNNDAKFVVISFDLHLNHTTEIGDRRFRSHITIDKQKNKLTAKVKSILADRLKESTFSSTSISDIEIELVTTHNNFTVKNVYSDIDCVMFNLKMINQKNIELNYLVLQKNFNSTRLNNQYKKELAFKYASNLNILVPKDFNRPSNKKIVSIKTLFECENVFYIDEYMFDSRFKSVKQNKLLTTEDFVTPILKNRQDDFLKLTDVTHWLLNNNESSVAIIYGSGGIGKTAVSEKIHDLIITEHERNLVIFIEADQYINVFKAKGRYNEPEYDIYNIFKQCHISEHHIDKNSFYLNYALGNIILIFDGIDEVISTIPTFSLNQFINTLEDLRLKIGRGKILINCRDSYVLDLITYYKENNDDSLGKIELYELLGFDYDLARTFFEYHFDNNELQVNLCLKLVNEFYPNNENKKYSFPPFILELIVEVVKNNHKYSEVDSDFNSNLLQQNDFNDLVIFRICNREVFKKDAEGFQLNIDKQIEFFCQLAIEEKGEINELEFRRILESIQLKDNIEQIQKGLSDHPLLYKEKFSYRFRFDFFNSYFKSLGIFNILTQKVETEISHRLIHILSYECNYDSLLFKNLLQRLMNLKEKLNDVIPCFKNLIQRILVFSKQDLNNSRTLQIQYKKSISNLFVLVLKSFNTSTERISNQIIIDLFSTAPFDKRIVSNFYIIEMHSHADVVLDFTDIIFTNSEINNYSIFFKCTFSDDTFFSDSCLISKVFSNKINYKQISASKKHFDRRISGFDNSIFRILEMKENGEALNSFFKNYLNSFYKNRVFDNKKTINTISINYDESITVELLTQILKNNTIVESVVGKDVFLNKSFENKIKKFLKQGATFSELNRSISELKSILFNAKT